MLSQSVIHQISIFIILLLQQSFIKCPILKVKTFLPLIYETFTIRSSFCSSIPLTIIIQTLYNDSFYVRNNYLLMFVLPVLTRVQYRNQISSNPRRQRCVHQGEWIRANDATTTARNVNKNNHIVDAFACIRLVRKLLK